MTKAAEKEKVSQRIVCLISGESGSGKTFFIANLKDALIYDSDLGGGSSYAAERISKNGSERVEVSSWKQIEEDLKKRAATNELRTNIVVDHITSLHQEAILEYNPTMGRDFGNSGNRASYDWRKMRKLVRVLDCNLYLIAHTKDEWAGEKVVGKTTDGAKNVEGDMHTVLYLKKPVVGGQKVKPTKALPSTAEVFKWRRDPDDPRGEVPNAFPFTLEEFQRIAGSEMTRAREAVELGSPAQVAEVKHLVNVIKLDEGEIDKWLKKVGVDAFEDAPKKNLEALLAHLKAKVSAPAAGEAK